MDVPDQPPRTDSDRRDRLGPGARDPSRTTEPTGTSAIPHEAVVWQPHAGDTTDLIGRPWGTDCPAAAALLPAGAGRILDLTGQLGPARDTTRIAGTAVGDPEADEFDPGPGPFDAILFGGLLERVGDPGRLLRRARAWLRPSGSVIARIANARHNAVLQDLLDGLWRVRPRLHLRANASAFSRAARSRN